MPAKIFFEIENDGDDSTTNKEKSPFDSNKIRRIWLQLKTISTITSKLIDPKNENECSITLPQGLTPWTFEDKSSEESKTKPFLFSILFYLQDKR